MSKVGKKPIMIPEGVTISIDKDTVKASGPKGNLELTMYPGVTIKQVESTLELSADGYEMRKFWGLMRALVQNMIVGVSEGYAKKMLVFGVGYTAKPHGSNGIEFTLGLSHKVYHQIPVEVKLAFEKDSKNNDILSFESINKELSLIKELVLDSLMKLSNSNLVKLQVNKT